MVFGLLESPFASQKIEFRIFGTKYSRMDQVKFVEDGL